MWVCRSGQTGMIKAHVVYPYLGSNPSTHIAWVTQPGLECHPPKVEVAGSNPVPGVYRTCFAGFPRDDLSDRKSVPDVIILENKKVY